MGKKRAGFGFDPDVCEGCEHHTFFRDDDAEGLIERAGQLLTKEPDGYWGCGLCKCPTAPGMPMDRFGTPPAECPYLDAHEGQ